MGKLPRFIAGIIGLVVTIPVILLVIFFITFDANALKKQVTQQLSAAIGREVAVEGPVRLGFNDGIALTLKDVRVGNPQGFSENEFLKVGALDLSLSLQALMAHHIDIRHFSLNDASIQLITNASGENNWEIKLPSGKEAQEVPSAEKKEAAKQASGFYIDRVDLSSIELNNTIIRRTDAQGKSTTILLEKASIVPPRDGALKIAAKGKLNDAPLEANIEVEKGWNVLTAHQPTPVEAKVNYGKTSYTLKALFEGKQNNYVFKNMQANLNGTDATGSLTVRTGGNVPLVSGNIDIQEINLMALPRASAALQNSLPARVQVLTAARIRQAVQIAAAAAPDLSFLKAVEANLDLTCARLVFGEGRTLEKIKTKAVLDGGVLHLTPLTADFLGVPYQGSIDVNAAATPPVTHVVMQGKNVDFEKLSSAFGGKAPLKAHGDIHANLTGQGLDGSSFLKSLNGRLEMTAGKGGVDLGDTGAAGIQLVRLLYPKTTATPSQNLNCAAARFNARNGVLNGDGILFDSPIAAVSGEGRIDLVQNRADLVLRHAVKDEQAGGFLNVPMRGTGPLNNMSFMPEEKAVLQKAQQMLMGGGEVSTGVPRVDLGVQGVNPCVAALNNPKPIMVKQEKPQDAAKNLAKGATDTYKGAADAIKGGKPAEIINNLKGILGH